MTGTVSTFHKAATAILLVGRRERRQELLNLISRLSCCSNTTAAEVVGLIVGTLELDQTAILGITPTTMQMRFIIHQFGHDPSFLIANEKYSRM